MSADPAIDRLVEAARCVPAALIARLTTSDDVREARLGQAIQDVRTPPPTDADEAGRVIDPVTHDPGW
ncbi:hypothetical protein [Streptomyces capoamus]|uniref:Uncharacterized protein n=1 Tax=Streptomyces capoamus TaxID=68183 RepID=A0A919C2G2_9ACTN|nr:hypothetical protein [Streptomyces capoamus]GGW16521.1 hypothetical protein GCM10010501_33220 [Streptomyces libani subsp. rufus]GHG43047.1 hypothetical protein GCM10018980_19630 [Streptomyces capoamus]